jgi:diacylglycerol O-acyltransferase
MSQYERLSALDASFLGIEDTCCHMHVGGVILFEAGPLRTPEGGLDIDRIRQAVHARLHLVPRFRQRLAYLPYERLPVWVDDDRFRLAYHVRHTALPRPGDERVLKRLVGRIMSQPLDRSRPLWEMWFVEGFDHDRFALISKTHHCMIDGISGADLISVIMDAAPNPDPGIPQPWSPRPQPSETRLLVDELKRRMSQPFEVLNAVTAAVQHPDRAMQRVEDTVAALAEALTPALRSASKTPVNVEVGPHRRFDWTTMKVSDFKAVKSVLGGTLNDVVLATVSGALRHFFIQRGADPDELDVRAMVPVSVRMEDERGRLGNRVTEMIAPLPVKLEDPVARLDAVRATMSGLKESKQALGGEVLTAIADWTVPNLLVQAVRLAERSRPYNLVVTNVPGPQIPLYFLGCAMETTFPVVPLFHNLALVVGLFSYNGGLFWGINADWEQVPDLHDFILALEESFRELQERAARAAKRLSRAAARRARASEPRRPKRGRRTSAGRR